MGTRAITIVTMVVGALALAACADHESGASNDSEDDVGGTVVDRCSQPLSCAAGEEVSATQLARRNGVCYLGGIRLEANGNATAEDLLAKWRATANSLDICLDGECMSCTVMSTPSSTTLSSPSSPSPQPSSGSCTGRADQCSSLTTDQCVDQDGCEIHATEPFGVVQEFYCTGSATACDELLTAETCWAQRGCLW